MVTPFQVNRDDVTPYYEALAAALAGTGPALAPHVDAAPDLSSSDVSGLALVVSTSGSTGTPKRAMLTRDSLIASATATYDRIGGPGTWLLPLPPQHIAGTQVLVRSIVAGTTPIVMPSWSVGDFVKATGLVARNAPPFSPIYTSFVPAQLRDVLNDEQGLAAARRYRAILVGGAATPSDMLARGREQGLKLVTTYGSSETAGGCVYDSIPLDGVTVHVLEPENGIGRIALGGPMIAAGYLGNARKTAETFITLDGERCFLTDDLGSFDGTLKIHGRIDDIINTGGYKVAPKTVESVLLRDANISEAHVVGIPDERFGHAVAAAVILHENEPLDGLSARLLDVCTQALPPYAIPQYISQLERVPLRGIGKPDRAAIAGNSPWQRFRR